MRERFDLDLKQLDRFNVLFHGGFGSGKTFLLGDMLRYERSAGEVRYLNITGEDGQLSIANFGLGNVGETVDTLDDFLLACDDYRKAGVRAVGVDGGKAFGKLVIRKVCGERLPSVGKNSDDWTQIHSKFENAIGVMRTMAPIVAFASSSDRSMDQISGELSLTPDMPGRQAAGIAGQFDFVFVVKAQATGPERVRRWIETAPAANTIIRQRLPRSLPAQIDIPQGGGGWKNLIEAMQKCLDDMTVKGGK